MLLLQLIQCLIVSQQFIFVTKTEGRSDHLNHDVKRFWRDLVISTSTVLFLMKNHFLLEEALADESYLRGLNYSLFRLSLQDKCWSRIPFPSKRRGMYPSTAQ